MAERVVDLLEVVDVDEEERQVLLAGTCSLEREVEALAQVRAVGEVRELVVVRLLVNPLDLRPDAPRHAGKERHEHHEEHEEKPFEDAAHPEERALRVPLDRLVRLDDGGRAAVACGASDGVNVSRTFVPSDAPAVRPLEVRLTIVPAAASVASAPCPRDPMSS